MCHHIDEALAREELRERHWSEEADEPRDDAPTADVGDVADKPAGEREGTEPPAEPRIPADD